MARPTVSQASRFRTTTLGSASAGPSTVVSVSAVGSKPTDGPVLLVDAENLAAVEFEKRVRKALKEDPASTTSERMRQLRERKNPG